MHLLKAGHFRGSKLSLMEISSMHRNEWPFRSFCCFVFLFFVFFRKRTSHGANEDEPLKYLCFTTCFEYIRTYHIYIYIFIYVLHQNSLLGCTILSSMNHLEPFWRMSKNHVFFAAPRRLVNWGRWGTEITESCTKFLVEFGCEPRQLPFLSLYSHGLFHTNPLQQRLGSRPFPAGDVVSGCLKWAAGGSCRTSAWTIVILMVLVVLIEALPTVGLNPLIGCRISFIVAWDLTRICYQNH